MNERRRICVMVTNSLTAKTFLRGYLRFLQEDGWDVTLVCSDGEGMDQLTRCEGVRFLPLEMKRQPSPLHDLRALLAVYRILRRIRPQVLVYATPKASLLGAVAGALAKVPARVYELWGLRLETSKGLARRVLGALESVTSRLSTSVIANSRSLALRAIELGVNGGKYVQVLGEGSSHGVDSSFYAPDISLPDVGLSPHENVGGKVAIVGFVGRLHPDKGIDTFVEALSICALRGCRLQALFVGGNEGVDPLNMIDGRVPVLTVGEVSDTRPYFKAMDVLVLPSRREGFPNVVLEAAAMKVPAVVSDATGCVDSVVPGVTGEIFPVGDSRRLADILQDLLDGPERLARLGEQARAHVVTSFAPLEVWAAHSNAFREALDVAGARGHG